MFQRRHYEAIAATLKANWPRSNSCRYFYRCMIEQFANTFAQDNPRFDWNRFLKACKIPD